jgi:tetratricopeptide (TPR) repeat protein
VHIDSQPAVVDIATTAPGDDWVGALSAIEDAAATPLHRPECDGLPLLARLEQQRRRLHSAVATGAASSADLDDWEETVLRHGYATRSQPTVDLLNDLEADFAELERALAGRHTSRALRRLTVVSAQMAGLTFLTLIKLNQPSSARLWARTARVAAGEAGDPAVDSWVRAQEAYVYYYSCNLTEAVNVARHAQARAAGTACVGVPLAAALEARALAAIGRRREAVNAVRRAETAVDKLDSGGLTRSAFGYDEAQLRFHEGSALTHLHDTESAWAAQRRALELYPDSDFLDRTLVHLDRATCLANDGDVPTAMHHATQALASLSYEQRGGLVTVRGVEILTSLPSALRASPAVKEFRDLLKLTAETGRKAI